MAFVISISILASSRRCHPHPQRASRHYWQGPSRCSTLPAKDGPMSDALIPKEDTSKKQANPFFLPSEMIRTITTGTMLEARDLCRIYSSDEQGFSNEIFFDCQMPLGGVPSLLLGTTENGLTFGGYTANGFLARDDYREASTEKAMFVFTVRDEELLIAEPTDLVQYDFYDYAVRFGAGLLGIPMNPRKHAMKADMATSSCRLPNGETSLFGEYTLAKLKAVQVLVASDFVEELNRNKNTSQKGFFARFFG